MRHGDKTKNLGRTASHRRALLSNLTIQLIEHKRITTTLAKAKSLRVYAEPIINRAKEDTTHNRRMVFSYLQSKEAIKELFGVVAEKIADRPGGYTRIIKLAPRMGDAAEMALIELVDFNELYKKDSTDAGAKKTRRSRRGGGGTKTAAGASTAAAVAPQEATLSDEQTDATATADTTAEAHQVTEPTAIASEEAGENDTLANTQTEGEEETAA
jgi:large subunit ribosomal protein L17